MLNAIYPVMSVMLLCTSLVLGQQKHDLKYAMREGQSWTFDQVTEGVQNSEMSAEGQPPFQGEQKMRQIRKGTITVVAVSNGIPSSVKVTFDQACVTKMKMQGQEQTINFPFAGATITISRDASGQVTNDFKGDADQMAAMELASYLPGSNNPFPPRAVAVDEQWDPDLTNAKKTYQITDQDKIVATNKLASITTIGGRRAAEVIGYFSVTKKMGEMEMNNTMKATMWYDLETGNMLQSSVDGTSSGQGVQNMNGPNGQPMRVNVKNSGQSQFRLETKVLEMGRGGNTPVVAPVNPINPPAGGALAGVYKSDKLTVELSGRDGRYTGTITLGAQSFPLTAEDAAGGVKGSFKVGQDSFDFKLTVNGDTATLTTGSTDYPLKKQGARPANPLEPGGGARPVNPLGAITPPISHAA